MNKIGIICDRNISSFDIEDSFHSQAQFSTQVYSEPVDLVRALESQEINGLVFGIKNVKNKNLSLIHKIKGKTPLLPVSFVSESISDWARMCLASYSNASGLLYPQELTSLNGIFSKMFRNEEVIARRHPRHQTHLQGLIHRRGKKLSCIIGDLSKGGVGCEINGTEFESDEVISIDVPLAGLSKRHTMDARVKWSQLMGPTLESGRSSHRKVGLEFCA